MMKKDLTLDRTALPATPRTSFLDLLARAKAIRLLARLYSALLEEEITPVRTLHLLHAQIAAIVAICPAGMPAALRLLCLVWAGLAIKRCARK